MDRRIGRIPLKNCWQEATKTEIEIIQYRNVIYSILYHNTRRGFTETYHTDK